MNRNELREFIDSQIKEILKYKWIESEKECCDIGENRAAFEWISKYASNYRSYWYKINLGKNSNIDSEF